MNKPKRHEVEAALRIAHSMLALAIVEPDFVSTYASRDDRVRRKAAKAQRAIEDLLVDIGDRVA